MPVSQASPDLRVARLAARQAGLVSRAQALALGLTDSSLKRRLRTGHWERVHPGVYQAAAVSPSWIGRVWAAALAVGPLAVVTHETALRLHGCPHLAPDPLTFTIPHGGHRRVRGAFVHQIDDLRPHHVVTVDGLPVSQPARAVVEVSATLLRRRLGLVLDDLVSDRRTTYAQVAARMAEVARPGKPGVVALAGLLDERSDHAVPAGSELERALLAALVGAGLPPPVQQMPVPGRGAIQGLVDAAYPHVRLILEADGRRWHTRVQDLRRDHERDGQAARAGWQTLRFVYEQIVHSPEEVAAVVADVIAVRSPEGREYPRQWGSPQPSRGNRVRPPTAIASGAGPRPLLPRVPVRADLLNR